MKKILLYILLLGFFSCSNETDLEILDLDTQNESRATTRMIISDYHNVLGWGYDITGDYLHPKSVLNPVLNIDKYRKDFDGRVVVDPVSSWGNDQAYLGGTSLDYVKDVNKETSADANLTANIGFSFTGSISKNTNFSSSYSYSSKYSFASLDAIRNKKQIRINDEVSRLSNYLSDEFTEDLNRLTPERLVERYGTHVLTDITVGGRYRLTYRSVIDASNDVANKKTAVGHGLGASLKKIAFNTSSNRVKNVNESIARKNEKQELYVSFYGGTGTTLKYDLEKKFPTSVDVRNWEETVNKSNMCLSQVNWKETYPLYEFIKDPTKKQQVKNVVTKKIKDSQIQVMELKALHRMHSNKSSNTYYVFTKGEAESLQAQHGDTYSGIDGYILAKPETGTRAIYRMHSTRSWNTYYLFSQADANYYNQRWGDQKQGIDGYFLTSSRAETRPMHCMHSNRSWNTYYVFSDSEARYYNQNWGDEIRGIEGYVFIP